MSPGGHQFAQGPVARKISQAVVGTRGEHNIDPNAAPCGKRQRIDELLARRNDLVYQAVNKNKANWE